MKLHHTSRFLLIVAILWTVLSYLVKVSPIFIPPPHKFAAACFELIRSCAFWWDCIVSAARVLGSVTLSTLLGIPIGFLLVRGSHCWRTIEAGVSFVRYLPPAGFVPLTMLWFGIDESQKVAVIFIGTFFQMVPLIAHANGSVDRRWVEIGKLAGAMGWKEWWHIVFPGSAPDLIHAIRIGFGVAWTYLTVAEIVAAQSGIGHRIVVAQRYLHTDHIFICILTIGILGMLTDRALQHASKVFFPWSQKTSALGIPS